MHYLKGNEKHLVRVVLNGNAAEGYASPRMLLSDFIRHVLGRKGTHTGCEHGVCGACTVRVEGIMTRACMTLAVQVDGAEIETVESLAPEPDRLSVLQAAFRRHHALQCGFCSPGILMSLDTLFHDERHADEERIRDVIAGHLCRCTGYQPIIEAALEAAAQLREETKSD